MNLFNNHNEPKRPVLSFSEFDKNDKNHKKSNLNHSNEGDMDFSSMTNESLSQPSKKDAEIPQKHPFKEKVIRAFDRKKILNNFDWKTIYYDIKKRAPYLLLFLILITVSASVYIAKIWDQKKFFIAGSKILYKEVKFESKLILPNSTSLAMIQHKDLIKKALEQLPEYESSLELKEATNISYDNKTKIVRIDVSSTSEEQSIKTANMLSNLALEANQQFYYNYFQEKFSNLSRQVMMAEQNLFVQDKMIAAAMKKTGALNVREQYRILMEAMSLQERNLLEAQIDFKQKKVQLDILKTEYKKMPDEVVRNAYEDNPVKAQLTNTKMALLSAQSIYGENNPNILAIKEKIEGLQKQLASQDIKSTLQKVYMPNERKQEVYMEIARAEGDLQSAENRILSIKENLMIQKRDLYAMPDKEMKLDDTLRKREAIVTMLDRLRKKRQDVEIMMRSEVRDIDLYETAEKAVMIQPTKLVAIPAVIFVLSCGFIFVYILFSCVFNQSIRTKKQLNIGFTIPCVMQLANSDNFESHLFNEIKNLVDKPLQQEFKNIICIQSDGKSEAAEDLAKYWLKEDKKVLLCRYQKHETDQEDEDLPFVEVMESNETISRAVLNAYSTQSEMNLLKEIKEMSFEYDYLIIEIPDKECDNTQLNIINISDWYFFVVNACKTSRINLIKRLKELEFKGVCPEGFILDKVNESLIQV